MLPSLYNGCAIAMYLWSYAGAVVAQNLTIPTETWRKPSTNLTREMREGFALNAAVPLSNIEISIGQPGLPHLQEISGLYTVLALQDYYSGNSTWHDKGTVELPVNVQGTNGFFAGSAKLYSDAMYWGLTFFYAHRAYNNDALLDSAVEAWNIAYSNAFISPSDAASSSGAGRDISFPPSSNCTGGTFAGGVFARADILNDTSINMETVGAFMTLSAYLYEKTQNTTYHDAGQLSLDFIINYLWNGTLAFDTIILGSCEVTVKPFSMNQGWFVEGLSVWANVTQNSTLTTLLEMVVPNVTKFPSWTSSTGIVNDLDPTVTADTANEVLKGIYIRGLAEAQRRNPGTALSSYIEAYTYVQLNALLDFAQAPPPNNSAYSRSWIGNPRATSFVEAGGNIAALDVLNAAFSFATPSSNSSAVGPTPTHTHQPAPTKSNAGAIAGGVVGGVAASAAVVIAVILLRRRRRHARVLNKVEGDLGSPGTDSVQPFVSRPAYNPATSHKSQRVNEGYGFASLSPAHPESTVNTTSRGVDSFHEASEIAELPGLVQRLNNLLQGRQHGELPPRYDD